MNLGEGGDNWWETGPFTSNNFKLRQAKSWDVKCSTHVFDEQFYEDHSVIEHTNAWIEEGKALLVRFEFSVRN